MPYASGNAASNPPPPSTSQVSLPSHTGATEFIAVSRSLPTPNTGNRMPMPRSKPSITTYMNTANPRTAAQTLVSTVPSTMRCTLVATADRGRRCDARRVGGRIRRIGLLRLRRPRHEFQQVPAPHSEHHEVHDDEGDQR